MVASTRRGGEFGPLIRRRSNRGAAVRESMLLVLRRRLLEE